MAMMHKVALSPDIVERVRKRRGGKLHAYDRFDGPKTALIVIDMQNAWVKEGMPGYTPYCAAIVPNIIRLAPAVRAAGGPVFWVRAVYGDDAPKTWSAYMEFMDDGATQAMLDALTEGNDGSALWPGLDVRPGDEVVVKRRFSALVGGSSDLEARLRARGVDTVISDANAAGTDELHNASLNLLFARFADVMTTDEALARIGAGAASAAAE
jgi:ureidoacrylate peracid hydrolase